jgi:hypothetical protein
LTGGHAAHSAIPGRAAPKFEATDDHISRVIDVLCSTLKRV